MSAPVDRELGLRSADVMAAQAVLDAAQLLERVCQGGEESHELHVRYCVPLGERLLELRGIIAVQLSDVRTAGYLEGLQVGRREAGQLVLETLRDEGLA